MPEPAQHGLLTVAGAGDRAASVEAREEGGWGLMGGRRWVGC